jgi:hypothetical protein
VVESIFSESGAERGWCLDMLEDPHLTGVGEKRSSPKDDCRNCPRQSHGEPLLAHRG